MRFFRPIRRTCLAAGCALALLASGLAPGGPSGTDAARAQAPAAAKAPVALTDALIERFVAAQAATRAIQQNSFARMQALAAGGGRPSDAAVRALEAEQQKLVGEAITAAGFASQEDFHRVGRAVITTFQRFNPATGTYDDPEAALLKRIAEIEADATMPAETRAQVAASLRQTLAVHRDMGVTPGNVEAVRRNLARIRPVLAF